jgi:uncharacterized membrane protein YhaH (DUF805 family)
MFTLFPLRIGRLAYILRLILWAFIPLFARCASVFIWGSTDNLQETDMMKFAVFLCGVVWTICVLYSVIIPRLRDAGISSWVTLLSLLPIINLAILIYLGVTRGKVSPEVKWVRVRRVI